MSDLLPCPFCGSTNLKTHVYKGEEPDAFVQCHDCSSTGPSGEEEAGAIEAWNRRAQSAQAVPLLSDEEIDSVWDAIPQTQFWWRRYARAIEQAVRAKQGVTVPTCEWTLQDDTGAWESSCGELWSFIDGGPAENRVSYCHGCGCKVGIAGTEGA